LAIFVVKWLGKNILRLYANNIKVGGLEVSPGQAERPSSGYGNAGIALEMVQSQFSDENFDLYEEDAETFL
jgi:hypothetical protein